MTVKIDTDAVINNVIFSDQSSNPATPSANKTRLFTKADGLYIINDDGNAIGPFITGSNFYVNYTEGAKVYNSGSISLPGSGSITTGTFNATIYDTDTIHSDSINNYRLTCKNAGKYIVSAQCVFSESLGTNSAIWIQHSSRGRISQVSNNTMIAASLSTIINLSLNDYVFLIIYKESVGAASLIYSAGSEYSPFFEMQRIG